MKGKIIWISIVIVALISDGVLTFANISNDSIASCSDMHYLTPIHSILCSVDTKRWSIAKNCSTLLNAGCLLGGSRCDGVMHVPIEAEVRPSPPPPDALNKDYQRLATIAETIVPKIWWRDGFDHDKLLLSHNDSELPRKLFNIRQLSNKKLRNIYQCVTRQVFIRVSLDFNSPPLSPRKSKCDAMMEPVIMKFFELWNLHKDSLGGSTTTTTSSFSTDGRSSSSSSSSSSVWFPDMAEGGPGSQLLVAAMEALHYFYDHPYGGIWTGCFRLEHEPDCRGAIAAAALIASSYFIADIAGRRKTFAEFHFVRGYLLASLGRHLLHGDSSSTGDSPVGKWGVKINDFVALQQAYLQLYIDSFGALYTEQLNKHIPLSFPPSFRVQGKLRWKQFASSLEPVYTCLRNWMFTEAQVLIDFGPYRPLVAFPAVRHDIMINNRRRVLVDIGANGFYASPKYLLDSYAVYLPFTHSVMVEPQPHFSSTVPKQYSERYNITFLPIYAEVGTDSNTDMIRLLPQLVTEHDFVVLKFDVDPNRYAFGPTMEWGFLYSLMANPSIADLVDEIYIELHFHYPRLDWKHYHSNWEALDAIRFLREQGVIVHSWS